MRGQKPLSKIDVFISADTFGAGCTLHKLQSAKTIQSHNKEFRGPNQKWNRSEFSRPDPTGKFRNHRQLTGRSTGFWPARSTGFFTEGFCSLFNVSNEKFSKRESMGEVLKFVTLDGSLRKKTQKNFCVFCKNDSILRPLLVKFRFEWPVLSSAKRAQNKHKKHWRAQAKLLDVLSDDILQKAKKIKLQFFSYWWQIICNLPSSKH